LEPMSKVGLPRGEMGKPREITAREHFIQLRISRELKRQVLLLAEEYDRTVSDVLRGALRFGVPVMEGLRSIEREFVRNYLKQLKEEISKSHQEVESET
jgi:hypothetical protein